MTRKILFLDDVNVFIGTSRNDTLRGTLTADQISGAAGDDTIDGRNGNDYIDGGEGADKMIGGKGNDTFVVDSQRDRVIELADEGIDTVLTALRVGRTPAHVENLTFLGKGVHLGFGNALDNVITGGSGADNLFGRTGNDTLWGMAGADRLDGGNGNDILMGGPGRDLLFGKSGNDVLDGGTGADFMSGGKGDDTYYVDNVKDVVVDPKNGGTDRVFSSVDFRLGLNLENLTLTGGLSRNGTGNRGDNAITGNAGSNTLDGNGGNDILDGGLRNDRLIGGDGADRFVFSTKLDSANNVDVIVDFLHSEGDRILLSTKVFEDVGDSSGRLTADQILVGAGVTRAQTADQILIYNTDTGALYYDSDGAGGRRAIQFATVGVDTHPTLDHTDFLLI